MSTKKYDLLVFIGRFQPVHNGHVAVIKTALEQADRVLILVGSANLSRSTHDPFTFEERARMIELAVGYDGWHDRSPMHIAPLDDVEDDVEWVEQVQEAAWRTVSFDPTAKIGLIGRKKDDSSYYLRLFPQWGSVDVQDDQHKDLNASDVRKVLFMLHDESSEADLEEYLLGKGEFEPGSISPAVGERIMQFRRSPDYADLLAEERYVYEHYIEPWQKAPYAPTFNVVDAVCVQSGQVLLIQRKHYPGKGKLALPGGFIKVSERLHNAMLRELKEETKIDLPPAVLRSSIKGHKIFDAPHRDPRGRFISTAFLLDLPKSPKLPAVKGSDDAEHAAWYDVTRLQSQELFADHHKIIKSMMRLL